MASYLWSDSAAYKLDYLPTRCIFGSKYALPNRLFAFSYVNCAPSQGSQIEHYSLQSLWHNGHKSPYLSTYLPISILLIPVLPRVPIGSTPSFSEWKLKKPSIGRLDRSFEGYDITLLMMRLRSLENRSQKDVLIAKQSFWWLTLISRN